MIDSAACFLGHPWNCGKSCWQQSTFHLATSTEASRHRALSKTRSPGWKSRAGLVRV
jgi:hypothetical protein